MRFVRNLPQIGRMVFQDLPFEKELLESVCMAEHNSNS